jgi:hypothetical protein
VAPADRERAFEPFGSLSSTEGGAGTGLGLAIARWVTDLHGGSIRFDDPGPGRAGARVRVSLPLEPRGISTPTAAPSVPDVPPAVPAPPLLDGIFGDLWPDRRVPARLSVVLTAVAVGVLGGWMLPFHEPGLGTFVVLLASGGSVLATTGRRRDRWTLTCAGLCVLLAATTVLRDTAWIVLLCLVAGGALCVSAVTGARTLGGFVLSGLAWPVAGLRGLPWLGRTLGRSTGLGHGAALLRTVVWSVLGLLVFGALFVSADALLAEWSSRLLPDLSLGSLVIRAFLAVAVGGVVLAAAYLALDPPRVDVFGAAVRPVAHRFEWLAPVVVVNAVFAAFLVAQAAAVFGGRGYVERQTGLTYADYVHQGFGQLTVATALILLVVWAAARKAPRDDPADRLWMRLSLGLLCVQTLVVVASALHRMDLYQDAYGFTQLRLLVDVFEGWLGLLVLAVAAAGIGLRAAWLPRFALVTGVVALLGLAAVNPDAWIARHNLDRYAATGKVDWSYLRSLSDDAVPVLAGLPAGQRRCALANRSADDHDWLAWNLGRSLAADHLPGPQLAPGEVRTLCPDS